VNWRVRVGLVLIWLLSMYVGARIIWGSGQGLGKVRSWLDSR
jgi:hypothetical protein